VTQSFSERDAVIRQLERDGNAYASAHELEVADFYRTERLRRAMILVRDFCDELPVRGHLATLTDLGVKLVPSDTVLVLTQGERTLAICPRDDLSLQVGDVIVQANRDCPVLDARCYDEITRLVFKWARH
jgi:hypothetical protein